MSVSFFTPVSYGANTCSPKENLLQIVDQYFHWWGKTAVVVPGFTTEKGIGVALVDVPQSYMSTISKMITLPLGAILIGVKGYLRLTTTFYIVDPSERRPARLGQEILTASYPSLPSPPASGLSDIEVSPISTPPSSPSSSPVITPLITPRATPFVPYNCNLQLSHSEVDRRFIDAPSDEELLLNDIANSCLSNHATHRLTLDLSSGINLDAFLAGLKGSSILKDLEIACVKPRVYVIRPKPLESVRTDNRVCCLYANGIKEDFSHEPLLIKGKRSFPDGGYEEGSFDEYYKLISGVKFLKDGTSIDI